MSAAVIAFLVLGAPETVTASTSIDHDRVAWDAEPRFGSAFAQLMVLQVSVWAVDKWVRKRDWADVTPQIWWRNISEGWEYDGDSFQTNNFAHPYHGAAYFSAGRSNGYNFWASSAFSMSGSVLWEYFGETYRPAFNDWINSGISGANLGEVLFRLSSLVTDNTDSGVSRVFREIGGTLIDPVRGFNRILSGDVAAVFPNPEEHDVPVSPVVQVGLLKLDADHRFGAQAQAHQILLDVGVQYGETFAKSFDPFSSFRFGASLALYSRAPQPVPRVSRIYSDGVLFGWTLLDESHAKHRITGNLLYDYSNNPAYELNQTMVAANWDASFALFGSLTFSPQIALHTTMLGAVPNDYFEHPDGRDYDIGPGLGFSTSAAFHAGGERIFGAVYSSGWIWPMSEPEGALHHLHYVQLDARVPFSKLIAFGGAIAMFWRESEYLTSPDVVARNPMWKLFFAVSP